MKDLSPYSNDGNSVSSQTSDFSGIVSGYNSALQLVDDVILKNYLSDLSGMDIVPLSQDVSETNIRDNVRFFKITEMVYEKEEFSICKFASVFNSAVISDSTIFIIIDSDGEKTDFYMGVRSEDTLRPVSSLRDALKNALKGQFPGIKTDTDYTVEDMQSVLNGIKTNSISAVSCVANNKIADSNQNEGFIQGLEKLVVSMQNEKYTGIIIAGNVSLNQLREIRKEYESIYTRLSPFVSSQINYTSSGAESFSVAESHGSSKSATSSETSSETTGKTKTVSRTNTHSLSKLNKKGKVLTAVAGVSSGIGIALARSTGGLSILAGSTVSALASALKETETDSTSCGESESSTFSRTRSSTHGTIDTVSSGTSKTQGYTKGSSMSQTLTLQDKSAGDILERINRQIKRIDEFESLGMFECAAYFMSDDLNTAEIAAANYKALMCGNNSGVEIAAINSWSPYEKDKTALISGYVKNFIHPVFNYNSPAGKIEVTPCSLVSGNELAIHMGLPRHSVCGLPVIEHADFGKEVISYNENKHNTGIKLGNIFSMGSVCKSKVFLDINSLSMHTFITGSTGSGKSTVIYSMLDKLKNMYVKDSPDKQIKFMVIEPAKGEYKDRFGSCEDVSVYGTNPGKTPLLRINPFSFPKDIHILEHIDRLVEIFCVCWPMYAAMPAVLKDAVERAYISAGWRLDKSECIYKDSEGRPLYPDFEDVLIQVNNVMNDSLYSSESKGDYKGALCTRLKSLTNGLYRNIFTCNEIPCEKLFDENVITDLSRTGSSETKALIMGLLVMKLQEYRMSCAAGGNQPLKHITVLEEAHHILRRSAVSGNPDSSDITGKSVEMISNSIAEMRTYGEGFIIADQSPGLMDMSVIRNTNTKIILRLPDLSDRELAGRAAGLNENQIAELSRLKTFVAAVYQNDWLEAVLCRIDTNFREVKKYEIKAPPADGEQKLKEFIYFMLLSPERKNRLDRAKLDRVADICMSLSVSAEIKTAFMHYINTDNINEIRTLRGKILYSLFNTESVIMLSQRYQNDIKNRYSEICRNLEPSVSDFSESECRKIVAILIKEAAEREKTPDKISLFENLMKFM